MIYINKNQFHVHRMSSIRNYWALQW